MKITAISDTHSLHHQLNLPGGDMLTHAGDVCNRGTQQEAINFMEWIEKQPYTYKVFIAGNHDFFFENFTQQEIQDKLPKGVFFLNDSGIEIEGIKIWGSPITPTFCNLAFNRNRGKEIAIHWDKIPLETDILITHGPPYGILDKTFNGLHVGCEELAQKVIDIKPKFHIFGHIHEAHGSTKENNTKYINAASVDIAYEIREVPYWDFEINT
jgi:Icc-related predicted phosphoesterase